MAQCQQQGPRLTLLSCSAILRASALSLGFHLINTAAAVPDITYQPSIIQQLHNPTSLSVALVTRGDVFPLVPSNLPLRYHQLGSCTPAVRDARKQVSSTSSFVGEGGFWQPGRRVEYWLRGRQPTVAVTELKVHRKCVCQDSLSSKGQKSS